ncbi:MAG: PKD domain-containing protein, partial [Anaerolineae bacterium]
DQAVNTMSSVTLDGSGSSDVDGDPLSYRWTQTGGPAVALSSATVASPTFTAPGDPAVFTFVLAVTDSHGLPALPADEVVITVTNQTPVANAGPPQRVPINGQVTLNAGGSLDPDGDTPLGWSWTQTAGTAVTLSDRSAQAPTFVAPSAPTTLVFDLVVTDALGTPSPPDEVQVAVYDPGIRQIYLPLVARRFVSAPDLVVRSLTATGNQVTLKIANQGSAAVGAAFWVDVYINPHTVPTAVNQPWYALGDEGLVWAVTGEALAGLVPGGEITLSVNDAYYMPGYSSVSWPIPAGSHFYAQVDSWNGETNYGAVPETHEIMGGRYNNIGGPFVATSALAVKVETGAGTPALDLSELPRRPPLAKP